MTRDEAVKLFDLDGVGRSPGRFDLKKLESVNAHYLKQADNQRLVGLIAPRIEALLGISLAADARELLLRSMDELKPRAKNLNELASSSLFLVRNRPLAMDEGAAKLLDADGKALLAETRAALAAVSTWDREALETAAKAVAEARGLGLGKVAGPLRAALTGQPNAPSVFAVMAVLGRDESIGRIEDALGS